MSFYCIGEKLSHSFSKEIHDKIGGYGYFIKEVPRDGLVRFVKNGDYEGLNVTIPYKELVMPCLDYIDASAKLIGSVNTVVRRGNKLYGYNTDVYGMTSLIRRKDIEINGKKVLVLGTGGTSKTANAVARMLGAKVILTVSRSPVYPQISYAEAVEKHSDADVIINTTPCGMYPNTDACPIDVSLFPRLSGVVDAVYNPLSTELVMNAKARGIKTADGLYMLVAQGVKAAEYFTGKTFGNGTEERIYNELVFEKRNIVLIGMPSSGKTTLGRLAAEKLGRKLVDTDDLITEKENRPITEIFKTDGEKYFRDVEEKAVREAAAKSGCVIATGGGAVLRKASVYKLRQNGILIFIDRPLEKLTPTSSRPLASDFEALKKRYEERLPVYVSSADVTFVPSDDAEANANLIIALAKNVKG